MATTDQLVKVTFLSINWVLYALCVIFFLVRLYIRWVCFRRFFVEDYFMVAAMVLLTGIEAMSQHFAHTIYDLMAWVNGTYSPPDLLGFLTEIEAMLKACGSAIILFLVGFYFIKVNFLLFFYRMGDRLLRIYRIVWWVVFIVVLACGIVSVTIGVTTFKCLFNGVVYTFTTCETAAYERVYFTYFRVSVALDIFTDALIIGFPVWLLWGIRINLRKKIALGGIFSLVGFTIVATILRGALLTDVFVSTSTGQTFNIPWVWFWFHIEFCIAFLVACLVSFRALFAHDRRSSSGGGAAAPAGAQRPPGGRTPPYHASGGSTTVVGSGNGSRGSRGKRSTGGVGVSPRHKGRFRVFQDSVLDTCRTLEGLEGDDGSLFEMDLVPGEPRPDVVAEQETIGGLRDLSAGAGEQQTFDFNFGGSAAPAAPADRADYHHYAAQEREVGREVDRETDRDSQGVSVLDDGPRTESPDSPGWPQRRETMMTSQLSLDSLYMRRSSHSGRSERSDT